MRRRLIHRQLIYRLQNAWYWLKCRLWHRYNVVVCRALSPTWHDRDYLLVYAAFQILEDFVTKERGHFYEDVYALYLPGFGDKAARARDLEWQRIRLLYDWWQRRKDDPDYDNYDEDSAMLHKLIDIRANLWT